MSTRFTIKRAILGDTQDVAVMVGELLNEIMQAIGVKAFNFNLTATITRLQDFITHEKYYVFIGREGSGKAAGFIALYESYALYAEGAFGTIPERWSRKTGQAVKWKICYQ